MHTSRLTLGAAALVSFVATAAHAQWIDDSTVHQLVADGAGEQVQPKIAPTADGGCYVSWFSSQTGYDVRLQRLDAGGNEMWAHNGILIADRNFSSTQDYDLDVDNTGHAVLVFRDDRFGGVKITAQRIAPDSSATWGVNGIQFGNGVNFVASPDIATTTDGHTVIAYINDLNTNLVQMNTAGVVQWNTTITNAGGDSISTASMHTSNNGSVIVSWVQYGNFLGPRHLYAQKISSAGGEVWPSRVAVYEGGSLQFGNYPEFVSDGSGGAVFSWYDTANGLNVYAQHLNSNGSERYPHNGVAASTFARERVAPAVNYDPINDRVYVAWVELDNNQGSHGVYAQSLDATGTRLWTDNGSSISIIDGHASGDINVQIMDGKMVTMWLEGAGGFGEKQVWAHALAPDSSEVWIGGSVQIASDIVTRSRLRSTVSSDGFIIAGWQIGDFGVADIQTHNINPDGSLGVVLCPADLTGDGILDFFDISAFLTAFGNGDPVADFTGDGIFDFFDISAFLTAFGAGCP